MIFSFTGLLFAEEEITTITIMNARQTSYKKAEDTGNDTIILEGSVVLSVQKDSTTTEVKADKITYDRKTEMLYAEGNVEITTKSSSSGGETTTASSLLMNTSTLEGVFDDGRVVQTQSDALNLPSGSTLIVFSDLFGKGNANIISFKNSSLTFCDEEDPHWHIDATRTWLLPGGEFAFFNALLYVGVVPVLYFPLFYYPKDELVFNPVFSYGRRNGYSIQTTTYLMGRKPLDTSTSSSSSSSDSSDSSSAESLKALYNFVKPSTLKEQKLEGIVLHNLDEDYTGDTSQYIKIMADWYSNLGAMVGVNGVLVPSKKYVTKLNFGLDLGFSDTIFKRGNAYFPFDDKGNKYYDYSTFLGKTFPFRYAANIDLTLSKPFPLSLSLPIYSDPFFASDFLTNRSETMDWISYFLDNSQNKSESPDETISEISSYIWQLSTSYRPSIPSVLNPYLTSLSFSLNSSVNISSVSAQDILYKGETPSSSAWRSYTPTRRFYYPSIITPAKISASVSGTIFQWPLKNNSRSSSTPNYAISLNKPEEFKTPKEIEQEAEQQIKEEVDNEDDEIEIDEKKVNNNEENLFNYNIPDLDYSVTKKTIPESITYALNYSINSEFNTQLSYSSSNLRKSEDFDWGNIRSFMYTISVPTTVSSNFTYGGGFLTITNNFSFNPLFQKHPYVSTDSSVGGYSESEKNNLYLADYNAEKRDINNTNSIVLKPFIGKGIFADSSISWNSNIKLFRRKFTGTAENPEWENLGVDWGDQESITVNSLSAVIAANEMDKKFGQSLTLTAVMPPLLRQYNANLALKFPYVNLSLSTGYQETTKDDVPSDQKWKFSPLQQTLSVSLFDSKLSLSENYSYNLQDKENDSLKFSASFKGMNLSYTMANTIGYDFDSTTGWSARSEKEFLPYSVSFSYSPSRKTYYKWFNRVSVSPGISTSIVADLLKSTDSYFIFSPYLSFKINEFLDITFSSTSRNSVLYWYFHDGMYDDWGGFPGNIVKDLIDSFRFDDEAIRRGSGFKLKSLNMEISHDLHDWKFNMTMKIEPRLLYQNGKKYYDFNPYITIGVVWNPMESMKTSIVDEYGEWKLE